VSSATRSWSQPAAVLAASARDLSEEIARALGAAVGRRASAGRPGVDVLVATDLASRLDGPAAAFCLELSGPCAGRVALLIGSRLASVLVALLGGQDRQALSAAADSDLTDSDLEDLGVTVSGALAGLAERLTAVTGEAPGLEMGDALLVPQGYPDEVLSLLGAGPYPSAIFSLDLDGIVTAPVALVFPRAFTGVPEALGDFGVEPGTAASGSATGVIGQLHRNIRRILRLQLPVAVVVAEKEMPVDAVLRLTPGTVIEFNKNSAQPLDLRVNDHKIGEGEVVTVGERFGLRLHATEGLQQRIRKLGAAQP
jgi:flagellar motor switch protein FliN/FliY